MYNSPAHVSDITENMLLTTTRITHHHLLPDSNSPFMTDFQYVDTIQI